MRILFICNEYPPIHSGGIGIYTKKLCEVLVSRGHEVFVHCMHTSIDNSKVIEINGVLIFKKRKPNIGIKVINKFYTRWKQSLSVRKIVKKYNIDLVESYEWSGPLIIHPGTILIVRLHGGHHAHAFFEEKQGSRLIKFFENRTVRLADYIVSVSRHIASLSKKAYRVEQPIDVIYNFFDPNLFYSSPYSIRDSNLFLFVGKFHERKGVYEMFDRIRELFEERGDLKFKFIGGYSKQAKKEVIKDLPDHVASRIEFIGHVPHKELVKYYNRAAFTLIPSRAEAFGLITIEAMACGSVVIMSEGHVSKELINNGKDGFRINFRKESSLLSLYEERLSQLNFQEISINAISKVRRFSMNQVIDENLKFYSRILKS